MAESQLSLLPDDSIIEIFSALDPPGALLFSLVDRRLRALFLRLRPRLSPDLELAALDPEHDPYIVSPQFIADCVARGYLKVLYWVEEQRLYDFSALVRRIAPEPDPLVEGNLPDYELHATLLADALPSSSHGVADFLVQKGFDLFWAFSRRISRYRTGPLLTFILSKYPQAISWTDFPEIVASGDLQWIAAQLPKPSRHPRPLPGDSLARVFYEAAKGGNVELIQLMRKRLGGDVGSGRVLEIRSLLRGAAEADRLEDFKAYWAEVGLNQIPHHEILPHLWERSPRIEAWVCQQSPPPPQGISSEVGNSLVKEPSSTALTVLFQRKSNPGLAEVEAALRSMRGPPSSADLFQAIDQRQLAILRAVHRAGAVLEQGHLLSAARSTLANAKYLFGAIKFQLPKNLSPTVLLNFSFESRSAKLPAWLWQKFFSGRPFTRELYALLSANEPRRVRFILRRAQPADLTNTDIISRSVLKGFVPLAQEMIAKGVAWMADERRRLFVSVVENRAELSDEGKQFLIAACTAREASTWAWKGPWPPSSLDTFGKPNATEPEEDDGWSDDEPQQDW